MRGRLLSTLMLLMLLEPVTVLAQESAPDSSRLSTSTLYEGDLKRPKVEFFAGADLRMQDVSFDHLYDALIYINPGMKWNIGKGWKFAFQFNIPIVLSGYDRNYWYPSLGVVALSKEFNWNKVDLKASAGLFSTRYLERRYGFDVKARYMPCSWLGIEGEVGITGFLCLNYGWQASTMKKVIAVGGLDFYLRKWNTEMRLRGGRFQGSATEQDLGAVFDFMRHFNHCTVGVYAQVSNLSHIESFKQNGVMSYTTKKHVINGGFTITMMIPPYHYKKYRKVRFRPASNFQLRYNVRGDESCRTYNTDPEENPRNGWFDHTAKQWEKK